MSNLLLNLKIYNGPLLIIQCSSFCTQVLSPCFNKTTFLCPRYLKNFFGQWLWTLMSFLHHSAQWLLPKKIIKYFLNKITCLVPYHGSHYLLGQQDQGGSGGINKMAADAPSCYPHLRTFFSHHQQTAQGRVIRGRQDLCRKPEPYLTQTPYKGISSYGPKLIPPVTCPNTCHLTDSQPLTAPP